MSACVTTDPNGDANAAADAGKVSGSLIASDPTLGLTEADKMVALRAEYRALEQTPAGAAVSWKNPDTGHSGDVLPGTAYQVNAQSCRDYTHTVTTEGTPTTFQATACRGGDGEWLVVT